MCRSRLLRAYRVRKGGSFGGRQARQMGPPTESKPVRLPGR